MKAPSARAVSRLLFVALWISFGGSIFLGMAALLLQDESNWTLRLIIFSMALAASSSLYTIRTRFERGALSSNNPRRPGRIVAILLLVTAGVSYITLILALISHTGSAAYWVLGFGASSLAVAGEGFAYFSQSLNFSRPSKEQPSSPDA